MAEVSELLKSAAIFKTLDDDELAQLADVCKEEQFVSGEYIFREGEHGNRLYLIVNGDVRISRDVPGSGEEALAVKVLWACVRLLSSRLRNTNDSLRSFLAMSMF